MLCAGVKDLGRLRQMWPIPPACFPICHVWAVAPQLARLIVAGEWAADLSDVVRRNNLSLSLHVRPFVAPRRVLRAFLESKKEDLLHSGGLPPGSVGGLLRGLESGGVPPLSGSGGVPPARLGGLPPPFGSGGLPPALQRSGGLPPARSGDLLSVGSGGVPSCGRGSVAPEGADAPVVESLCGGRLGRYHASHLVAALRERFRRADDLLRADLPDIRDGDSEDESFDPHGGWHRDLTGDGDVESNPGPATDAEISQIFWRELLELSRVMVTGRRGGLPEIPGPSGVPIQANPWAPDASLGELRAAMDASLEELICRGAERLRTDCRDPEMQQCALELLNPASTEHQSFRHYVTAVAQELDFDLAFTSRVEELSGLEPGRRGTTLMRAPSAQHAQAQESLVCMWWWMAAEYWDADQMIRYLWPGFRRWHPGVFSSPHARATLQAIVTDLQQSLEQATSEAATQRMAQHGAIYECPQPSAGRPVLEALSEPPTDDEGGDLSGQHEPLRRSRR